MANSNMGEDPADDKEKQRKEASSIRAADIHIDIPTGLVSTVRKGRKALDIDGVNIEAGSDIYSC